MHSAAATATQALRGPNASRTTAARKPSAVSVSAAPSAYVSAAEGPKSCTAAQASQVGSGGCL